MTMNPAGIYASLALAIATSMTGISSAQVTTVPASPKAHQTVRVVTPRVVLTTEIPLLPFAVRIDPHRTTTTMAGNRIAVTLFLVQQDLGGSSDGLDLPLGEFPAGNYEVTIDRRLPNGNSLGGLPAASFTVTPRSPGEPLWNHTDMWWDPAESGWGLSLIHHALGQIFATWFVYGADGKPTWYVMPGGQWQSTRQFQGSIYRTTGPDHAACTLQSCPVPFNPALVTATSPGFLQLRFSPDSPHAAQAIFFIDGRFIIKGLRRQAF